MKILNIILLSLSTFLVITDCYPVRKPFIVGSYLKRGQNNNIGQNDYTDNDFERYLCIFKKGLLKFSFHLIKALVIHDIVLFLVDYLYLLLLFRGILH